MLEFSIQYLARFLDLHQNGIERFLFFGGVGHQLVDLLHGAAMELQHAQMLGLQFAHQPIRFSR